MEANTYKAKEVAALMGVSVWTYNRWVREGTAPVMPIKGTHKYSKALVDFIVNAESEVQAKKAEVGL